MNAQNELLLATTNRGKIKELTEIFRGVGPRLRTLAEFGGVPEAEETGATFEENAVIKARYYSARTGLWTLADDSGLEVEALGGAPGVYSARYGGRNATYPERIARLLAEIAESADERERRARFVCVIALAAPDDEAVPTFTGECRGHIAHAPRGANGFGYDPVFIPEGHAQTFGELPDEVKQHLSHRARAAAQVREYLGRRQTE